MTETNRSDPPGVVCVVDDDTWVCDSLNVLLQTFGFAVLTYSSGEAFLADERHRNTKCLVIDQHMPGLGGLAVIERLHRTGFRPPTVLITGRLDPAIVARAGEYGLLEVLEKPFPVARLIELLSNCIWPPGQGTAPSD